MRHLILPAFLVAALRAVLATFLEDQEPFAIGATGLGQIYELVTQLRQKAGPRQVDYARVAVQENGGGLLGVEEGAAVVTVLSR